MDLSNCTGGGSICGNGELEEGEDCDGNEFRDGKNTCMDWGANVSGSVTCGGNCLVDLTNCGCGNGVCDPWEDTFHCTRDCRWTSVAVARDLSCGVYVGRVYCWGDLGALGMAQKVNAPRWIPLRDQNNQDVGALQVAVGGTHACAWTESGVYCWGTNGRGQLGAGDTGFHSEAVYVPFSVNMGSAANLRLALGYAHSCAAWDENGKSHLACWGDSDSGQALAESGAQDVPIVQDLSEIDDLTAGAIHTIVVGKITDADSVSAMVLGWLDCPGACDNTSGILGNGTCSELSSWHPIRSGMASGVPVGTCGADSESGWAVSCWTAMQITNGGRCGAIQTLQNVVNPSQLAVGMEFVCWVSPSDETAVHCREAATFGESSPDLGSTVVQLDAGRLHWCALVEDGWIVCGGNNQSGQLGNGLFGTGNEPLDYIQRVEDPEIPSQ